MIKIVILVFFIQSIGIGYLLYRLIAREILLNEGCVITELKTKKNGRVVVTDKGGGRVVMSVEVIPAHSRLDLQIPTIVHPDRIEDERADNREGL